MTCDLCDAEIDDQCTHRGSARLCRACARDVDETSDDRAVPDEFDDDDTCDYREEDVVS